MSHLFEMLKASDHAYRTAFEQGRKIGYQEGYNAKTDEVNAEFDRQNELMKKENEENANKIN